MALGRQGRVGAWIASNFARTGVREIMPAFLVRMLRRIEEQGAALVHFLRLNCSACIECAGNGRGIWRREERIMRLGPYQLVFLVLVGIRAVAAGLRFAPNEERGGYRRGHVLGMYLLSIATSTRWQRASTACQRSSTAAWMRSKPEPLTCA